MHEKFGKKFFSQSKPVWLGDLGRDKNKNKIMYGVLYSGTVPDLIGKIFFWILGKYAKDEI